MKGDFSRVTFAEKNHYRRVLMQQGRVEIDADGNEQVAIDAHIAATTGYDVIGQSGYPLEELPDGTPAGGFAIDLKAGGGDLTISKGRIYVDGLLVENESDTATLLSQPDTAGATLAELGATQAGVHVVYLDVWERLITALDNPQLRETALGGPDTSVRTKVVWQVKLAFSGPTPAAVLPTCASVGNAWLPSTANQGTLAASSGPPAVGLPCILPPETGFQRLENQLYRVEIHNPGPDGTATFKWSRENGSIVAAIVAPLTTGGAPPPTTVTGPTFVVASLSDDPSLGLRAGDWVELTDDHSELIAGHGQLFRLATTPTDGHTVTITAAGPPTVTLALHPKLRRWDQVGAGLDQGIKVTTGAPIALEGGVRVQFSSGNYHTGDYWVVPARTATSLSQGFVEWPVEGTTPVPQPPLGIRHHYAKLALVNVAPPGTFSAIGANTGPTDCRLPFLPLTDLMPKQSLSPCTIVVRPGEGWQQPILDYFAAAPEGARLDAEICFPVGVFPVVSAMVISSAGHIKINGAGWGTRLIGAAGSAGPESVLAFSGCSSVSVSTLYGETSNVISGRTGKQRNHINGTIAFTDCGEVNVEGVFLRCGSAVSQRGAACISVLTSIKATNATTGDGSVRIRGCRLHVGEMQVGIQVAHQLRATIEDNEILVDPTIPLTTLTSRLSDVGYRAIARGFLVSQAVVSPPPKAKPQATGTVARAATPADVVRAVGPQPAPPAGGGAPASGGPGGPGTTPPTVSTAIPSVSTSPQVIRAPIVGPEVTGRVASTQPTGAPQQPPAEPQQPPAPAPPPAVAVPPVAAPPVTVQLPPGLISVLRNPAMVTFGGQNLTFNANPELAATWQTFLAAKAPQQFATQADALKFMKAQATSILLDPNVRAGFTGFGSVIHTLSQHVPLAGRGIVVGGQAVGDVHILNNALSGAILGISVGVSHKGSAAEQKGKQRTPDHAQTIRIAGNTVHCEANDVAGRHARFGIFVGSADSLEIADNRLTLAPVGIAGAPFADAIRVIGYLGAKAIVRHNHTTGFGMGIRVVPLEGNGPGRPVTGQPDFSYLAGLRGGEQWLVADNVIEGGTESPPPGPFTKTKPQTPPLPAPAPIIEAGGCLLVNNIHR